MPEMTKCRIVYSRRPSHSVNATPFTCMTMYSHLLTWKINAPHYSVHVAPIWVLAPLNQASTKTQVGIIIFRIEVRTLLRVAEGSSSLKCIIDTISKCKLFWFTDVEVAFTLKSGDHQGFKWQVDTAESFQPQPEPNIDPSTYGLMGTLMIARRECGNDKQYKHTHIHPHTVVHTIADRRIYATSKLPRWVHRVREDVRGETLRCETVWHRPVCQMSYPHLLCGSLCRTLTGSSSLVSCHTCEPHCCAT